MGFCPADYKATKMFYARSGCVTGVEVVQIDSAEAFHYDR